MMNWNSAGTLREQAFALDSITATFIGVYVYEFAISTKFDWMLVNRSDTGRAVVAKSVKWLYMLCRYSCLANCVGLALAVFHGRQDCSIVAKVVNATGIIAVTSSTILLFIRVGVVRKWNKWITAIFACAFVAIFALGVRVIVKVHGQSNGLTGPACTTTGFTTILPNVFMNLLVDGSLLLFLFAGLRRWTHSRKFNVWNLLWNQGLVYLSLAVMIELPMTIFLFLNFNPIMPLLFYSPFSIILPIAATRFYRSLTTFRKGRTHYTYESMVVIPVPRMPNTTGRKPFETPERSSSGHTMGYEMDDIANRPT
ncbi:unnamed protein product [Peniophora sp. CBMAI 1063]|nr:unnamed protein product [Peniophora sp. CBMAI 1063]